MKRFLKTYFWKYKISKNYKGKWEISYKKPFGGWKYLNDFVCRDNAVKYIEEFKYSEV